MHKHATIFRSFKNAFWGLRHGCDGRNFMWGIIIGTIVIAAAYLLPLTNTERFLIMLLTGLVLAAELINSAIEEFADVLITEHHPGIARVKELSAAAVLLLVIVAGIIGGSILLPYLLHWPF